MKTSTWRRWCKLLRGTQPAGARALARARRQSLGLERLEDRVTPSLTPQMVLDINTKTPSANPSGMVAIGSTAYFAADDSVSGDELWRSDGTIAGTTLVKDIFPGGYIGYYDHLYHLNSSSPDNLININGTLFFTAHQWGRGWLWKSDGTGAGTVQVSPSVWNLSSLTVVNGTLFFTGSDDTHGPELWKSDGSVAGTTLVKEISPGGANAAPRNLTNVSGTLFFTADDGVHGWELWKSDGTAAGTKLVKDIVTGTSSSDPGYLTNVNGTLFFRASNGTSGTELWKSNGTAAGTTLVKDIDPGSASSSPSELTNASGTLFFQASDGTNGPGLWKSNGTAAGTVLVSASASSPRNFTNVNGTLFFTAGEGTNGLWKSDGTPAGTALIKHVNPATTWSELLWLTNVNGTLFFTANDGTNGRGLWTSDGTALGTMLVKDLYPGRTDSDPTSSLYPAGLTNVNGTLLFAASDGQHGVELWRSNGTAAGTTLVKDINIGRTDGSYPANPANVNGTLFFVADDGVHGRELWRSDGTVAGTTLVKDLLPGGYTGWYGVYYPNSSNPRDLTNVNGRLFFTANDTGNVPRLWKSDGTAAGTAVVSPSVRSPGDLTNVNGTLFFRAYDGINGFELWKSDGTTTGTTLVKDICPGQGYYFDYWGNIHYVPNSSYPVRLSNVNGTLFFVASDGTHGTEVWKSDGTATGTVLLKDIRPSGSAFPAELTNVNGMLFFEATDDAHGRELWKSDGTTTGTVLVRDILPGAYSSYVNWLTNVNGRLFFRADDGIHGLELWKSDGTAAGTALVKDIWPGSIGSNLSELTDVNGTLFFSALEGTDGRELWKSDGTVAGTTLVKDLYPGTFSYYDYYGQLRYFPNSSKPENLTNVNGTLFFTARDDSQARLWQSNGTEAGTTAAVNLASSSLANVNGTLFFAAVDEIHGRELWKLADDSPALTIGDATVTEGNAGTHAATFTVTLSAASTLPVTVHYTTADCTASAPSDYTAVSGTLTFAPGETSKTLSVLVKGDRRGEADETFYVHLSAATNATIATGQGRGTILDDEPRITISDTSGLEGNTGTVSFIFTVSLSRAYDAPVTVHYATANGSATAGSDYQAASGTLTFAPGQTSQSVTVLVYGDRFGEANETFRLNLGAATSALITDPYGVGTILDDEPRLRISDVRKQEGQGGVRQFVFTVTLSAAYDQPVTVSFQTADGTATTSDQDYAAQSGTLTFAPGETTRTITILVMGDTKQEADELFYVDLFGSSSNAWVAKRRGIGRIVNDD
jgi:ELWxxDGT repeat protein